MSKQEKFEEGETFRLAQNEKMYRMVEDPHDREYLEVSDGCSWEFALWIDAILPGRILLYGPHGLLIPIDFTEMIFV